MDFLMIWDMFLTLVVFASMAIIFLFNKN